MEVLRAHGVQGVRVEHLAKVLKVTKGSFYWHFKDRDALLEAMLEEWRRQNRQNVAKYLDGLEDPAARLEKLARIPFDLEEREPFGLPLRLWARHDERARKAVAEVDDLRLGMMAQTFAESGFSLEDSRARAVLLYAYMRVAPTLANLDDTALRGLCERLLLKR
jgi:AcrR family transcriptional regulator